MQVLDDVVEFRSENLFSSCNLVFAFGLSVDIRSYLEAFLRLLFVLWLVERWVLKRFLFNSRTANLRFAWSFDWLRVWFSISLRDLLCLESHLEQQSALWFQSWPRYEWFLLHLNRRRLVMSLLVSVVSLTASFLSSYWLTWSLANDKRLLCASF